ncbi:MAG: hypothetical protein WB507_01695 [Solirubrobacterales bacterium]
MRRQNLSQMGPAHRCVYGAALLVSASLLAALALAAPAQASEGVDSFGTSTSTTAAGGHPDISTSFMLHDPGSPEVAQNVIFNAPEGLFGNPYAVTHCTSSDFALDQCPSDSQVGLVTVYSNFPGNEITQCSIEYGTTISYGSSAPCSQSVPIKVATQVSAEATGLAAGVTYHYRVHAIDVAGHAVDGTDQTFEAGGATTTLHGEAEPYLLGTAPIFDVDPQASETALFAFIVPTLDIPINIPVAVRTAENAGTAGDYGLRFTVQDISQATPLAGANLSFWGFPAESSHDAQRFPKGISGEPANCPGVADTSCLGKPVVSSIPVQPLTDNPTTCSGPLSTSLRVETYGDPEHPTTEQASYPATTSCDLEVFNPVLYASPTTNASDSPSGLNLDLSAPQFLGRAASPSELRKAIVTLPEGFTINPDAADGQTMCTEEQANFGSEGPAHCPDNAKIGTFSIGTQALPGRLEGSVYIGEPQPGNQYRLFEIASGFGINAKFVGTVRPDPVTGRLTAYFENLPQVPFEDFQLHLFSSDRGLMATPTRCGVYTTAAEMYPWNETLPEQESAQVFSLETGPNGSTCPGQVRPFEPTLLSGTSNPVADAYSSFTLKLNREDGDQYLGKLNFTMPPGLTANLHGVTYCPEADILAAANTLGKVEQANPSCPASSEIGTSNVAAGPGSHPFHAYGKIYLAGPFQGAPLSLVAITPALAGPYDYGTVVVRVALHVDQRDAHVVADSETVPEIIGGIPIRMREIQVNINKPNFMINPTNCSEFQTVSEGVGDQGTRAAFSSPFIAVNCATLGFTPKMAVTQLGGHRFTARGKDPALQFDLNTTEGDANLKSVSVTLPKTFEIDQRHLGNLCSRSQLEREHCAGRQPIGFVKDETPLLEKPLEGPAYAVSGFASGKNVLPHIAFILGGQVTVVPQAESMTLGGGRLKTVVPVIPDVPIGHFRFTLLSGAHGYISNTESLCAAKPIVAVTLNGQNGKTLTQQVKTKTACKAKKSKRKARRHARR